MEETFSRLRPSIHEPFSQIAGSNLPRCYSQKILNFLGQTFLTKKPVFQSVSSGGNVTPVLQRNLKKHFEKRGFLKVFHEGVWKISEFKRSYWIKKLSINAHVTSKIEDFRPRSRIKILKIQRPRKVQFFRGQET